MIFEQCTLNGKQAVGTGALLKREDIPDGYYCYDIYTPGEYLDAQHTIALQDLSDHANGSIILAEPLDFQGKAELGMGDLILHEESPLHYTGEFHGTKSGAETVYRTRYGFRLVSIYVRRMG